MEFFFRCCYHLAVGLLVSIAWLIIAAPSGRWAGPGNTETYWFGMYLVLFQLMLRSAVYAQRKLPRMRVENRVLVGLRVATPYLLEVLLYSVAALKLMTDGGSDMLTTPHSPAAYDLALLSFFCLWLLPLCSLLLGWRLSQSKLPAWLPVASAACLCVLVLPSSFQLTEFLIPGAYPLLPVCGVALCALLFLLLCSRFPAWWFRSTGTPHRALALACLLPGFFALILVAGTLEIRFLPEVLAGFLLGLSWVALAACPAYLFVWLLPWRPKGPKLIPYCGALGVLVFYNMAWLSMVVFSLERAPWMPPWDWHFLIGAFSALAPACITERSKDAEQSRSALEGIMEPANKIFASDL